METDRCSPSTLASTVMPALLHRICGRINLTHRLLSYLHWSLASDWLDSGQLTPVVHGSCDKCPVTTLRIIQVKVQNLHGGPYQLLVNLDIYLFICILNVCFLLIQWVTRYCSNVNTIVKQRLMSCYYCIIPEVYFIGATLMEYTNSKKWQTASYS